MSMAELSVSLVVFSVLIAATLLVTMQVQRLFVQDSASEDSMNAARHAMEVAVKDLHAATADTISGVELSYSETEDTAITFYVPTSGGGLTRVRLYRDSSARLWRQTTLSDSGSVAPNYTFSTNRSQRTEQLAAGVADATSGTPLFSYVVNGAVSTNVSTDTDRASITAVVITLTAAPTSAGTDAAPVTLVNTVTPLSI
jgi:type II secretory pathway pseudopilin PulG